MIPAPPDSFVPFVLYRLTCGDVKERESETDGNCDICHREQIDGGRKWETESAWWKNHFSLSPFSFPFANPQKLMKTSMIMCCSAILCFPLSCQAWGDAGWWQSCHRFYHRLCFYWFRISHCRCLNLKRLFIRVLFFFFYINIWYCTSIFRTQI